MPRNTIPKDERHCRIDGCARDTGDRLDICQLHYFRIRQGTKMDKPVLERYGDAGCGIPGCEKPRAGKYCSMHYTRISRHSSPDVVKKAVPHSGPENGMWKGDDVRYESAHQRHRVKASRCVRCEGQGKNYQWALNWMAEPHARCNLVGERSPFSTRKEDYIELCIPCHKRMDLGVIAERYNVTYGKGCK